jgi:hypothetical protein
LVFLNANQALGGRELELFTLDLDDSGPDFLTRLSLLIDHKKPSLIIGGAANSIGDMTAEHFRRRGILWHGPWSNSPELNDSADQNPLLILPTEDLELAALMELIKKKKPEGGAHFVHLAGSRSRAVVNLALAAAKKAGVSLTPIGVSDTLRDLKGLATPLKEAQAILLWLPPGQSAAVVRAIKPFLPPETMWLTKSLNSPSRELINLTNGHWSGLIFASVLKPQAEIEPSYNLVIRKYGLPGLSLDYQTYLGFAQGQILARALNNQGRGNLKTALTKVSTVGTLFGDSNNFQSPKRPFYLAISDRQGGWSPID